MNQYIIVLLFPILLLTNCNKNINCCCNKGQEPDNSIEQKLTKPLLDIAIDKIGKQKAKPTTYLVSVEKGKGESFTIRTLNHEDEVGIFFEEGIDNLIKSKKIALNENTLIPIVIRVINSDDSSIQDPNYYQDIKKTKLNHKTKILEPICIHIFQ